MDKDILEFLYQSGKMPFRYYAQQNGKSPQENYKLSKYIIHDKLKQEKMQEQISADIAKQVQTELEKIFLSLQ